MHLICVVLVFMLIYKIKPNVYLASVVAFVFALHPMHIESVSWISERKDVLYSIFYLTGLIAYLNFTNKRNAKNYSLTLLFFILSLFSKAVAVSFPLILVAFDWYKGRKLLSKNVILEKIPFFALSLTFGLIGIYFTSSANDTSTPDIEWIYRPFIVGSAMMIYLYKFIAPFNLMNYYYYPDTSKGILTADFYISTICLLIVIAGLIWWLIKSKQQKKDLILGLAIFIIPTFFILQIIPAGRAYAAERYTYLSYIGLAYIFGIVTCKIIQNKNPKNTSARYALIAILIFLAFGFSYLSYQRNKDWKDSFSLFDDLIKKNPEHAHPYLIRGITHIQFGNHKQALADYNKSIELDPDDAKALANRSSARGMLGDYDGALEDANRSLEIWPGYENALNNRATALFFKEEYNLAIEDYNTLLMKRPSSTDVIRKRITALKKVNRPNDLLHDYLMLTTLEPKNHMNFAQAGEIYYQIDSLQQAIDYFSQSMLLKPGFYQPLFLRANAYYKQREFEKALADFTQYAESTNDSNSYYNMGMCNKMLHRVGDACKWWEKALELGHQDAPKRLAESCK